MENVLLYSNLMNFQPYGFGIYPKTHPKTILQQNSLIIYRLPVKKELKHAVDNTLFQGGGGGGFRHTNRISHFGTISGQFLNVTAKSHGYVRYPTWGKLLTGVLLFKIPCPHLLARQRR